jgi:sialidase-1
MMMAQEQKKYKVPVLKGKEINPVIRLRIDAAGENETLQQMEVSIKGAAIRNVKIFSAGADSAFLKGEKPLFAEGFTPAGKIKLKGNLALRQGANYLWVTVTPDVKALLTSRLNINVTAVQLNNRTVKVPADNYTHRLGIALRQHNQDSVHTYRIPGLATAKDGTLLAIFDVRREI